MPFGLDKPLDGRGSPMDAGRAATWHSQVPSLLACVRVGRGPAHDLAVSEIDLMARAADAGNLAADTLRGLHAWFEASSIPRAYWADQAEAIATTIGQMEAC